MIINYKQVITGEIIHLAYLGVVRVFNPLPIGKPVDVDDVLRPRLPVQAARARCCCLEADDDFNLASGGVPAAGPAPGPWCPGRLGGVLQHPGLPLGPERPAAGRAGPAEPPWSLAGLPAAARLPVCHLVGLRNP